MVKRKCYDLLYISKEMEKISYDLLENKMNKLENREELCKKIASMSGTIEAISFILKVRYCK